MATLEFYFDCSSPWTYLAFSRIHAVIERTRAKIVWKPILVGGIFNAVNPSVYERRANPNPRQKKYYDKDLQDWARYCGIRIGRPPVFPVRAVEAMRGAFVAEAAGLLIPYAWATFEAYWGDLKDISQEPVLTAICDRVGLDRAQFFAGIAGPAAKERLRQNTEEVIARGGFGSPTMFVDGSDMYFGIDRLPLVEAALARGSGPAA